MRLPGQTPDGRYAVALAITPDGDLVYSSFVRTEQGAAEYDLWELDADSGSRTRIASTGPSTLEATRMLATERRLVWLTGAADGNMMQDHWTLWSMDRRTHRVTKLVSAPVTDSGQRPTAPLRPTPTLGGDGRVYLGTVRQLPNGQYRPFVESMDPRQPGQLRVEMRGVGPIATASRLVWAAPGAGPPRVMERGIYDAGAGRVLFDATGTGCLNGVGLQASGDVTAWALDCRQGADRVYVSLAGRLIARIESVQPVGTSPRPRGMWPLLPGVARTSSSCGMSARASSCRSAPERCVGTWSGRVTT